MGSVKIESSIGTFSIAIIMNKQHTLDNWLWYMNVFLRSTLAQLLEFSSFPDQRLSVTFLSAKPHSR